MKLGLLMEAAQAQQALAAAALQQLREHTGGLDAIVREEIRGTLIEELTALGDDSRRAAQTLRGLSHVASFRVAAWSVGVTALSAAIPFGVAWWMLPSRAETAARRAARAALTPNVARLTRQGARVGWPPGGAPGRLWGRAGRAAPMYGEAA